MGIKNLLISMTMVSIIIFMFILFAYNFQDVNNSAVDFSNDADIQNLSDTYASDFNQYSSDSQELTNIYYNTTVREGTDNLIVPSQDAITKKSRSTPYKMLTNSISYVYKVMIGNQGAYVAFVFDAIIGMILTVIAYYTIKYLRQGE